MKKILVFICLLVGVGVVHAQTEEKIELSTGVKSFGGFLLDMTQMNLQAAPQFSGYKLEIPDASKDYSKVFRLDNGAMYSQGFFTGFVLESPLFGGMGSLNLLEWGSSPVNLQMGSFRLKNGLRIYTYGQYNKEGRKVYNPASFPWERNNFKGAFELKSPNGAFGFRLEVQHR